MAASPPPSPPSPPLADPHEDASLGEVSTGLALQASTADLRSTWDVSHAQVEMTAGTNFSGYTEAMYDTVGSPRNLHNDFERSYMQSLADPAFTPYPPNSRYSGKGASSPSAQRPRTSAAVAASETRYVAYWRAAEIAEHAGTPYGPLPLPRAHEGAAPAEGEEGDGVGGGDGGDGSGGMGVAIEYAHADLGSGYDGVQHKARVILGNHKPGRQELNPFSPFGDAHALGEAGDISPLFPGKERARGGRGGGGAGVRLKRTALAKAAKAAEKAAEAARALDARAKAHNARTRAGIQAAGV